MISYTPEFEAIMKQPEKVVRVTAFLQDDDTQIQVWSEDLRSVELNSSGMFLSVGSRVVTASVFNDQSPLLNSSVTLKLEGLKQDGSWESIELGRFTVFQVEYNIEDQLSKVVLYDAMMMMSTVEYNLSTELFPMTVTELAQKVADTSTSGLDPNFANLPNADYLIEENLWETIQNTSYRDVVSQIAEVTGTTAVVSGQTLMFKQFGSPDSSVVEDNLLKFRMGQKWGNVNSVSLSRMPQNDNILLRDDTDVEANGLFEVTVINNQIVDDDRQTLIQPLYDELVTNTPHINFYDSEFTTEGHGWYEIGDVVEATLSGIDYPVFVTKHYLYIGPESFTERITSIIPTNPAVNKTTAGGILRSLWNTEIKVDKQNNEIISVVERQDEFENQTENNFTQITQNVNSITSTIQDGGGMNQILNSVGYSIDRSTGTINFWDASGLTATSVSSTSAFTAGAISGSEVSLSGGPGTFTQRVSVNPGGSYVISFYAKKSTQGVVTVSATNELDSYSVSFDDDTSYGWGKYRINEITPTSDYLDITFTIDGDVELFQFTDLVMVRGIADKGWYQAAGEVANSVVTFDTTGITVSRTDDANNYTGERTVMTPQEFAGYNGSEQVFAVNKDTTSVKDLEVRGSIDTPEVLIVSVSSGPNAGMNFVVKG